VSDGFVAGFVSKLTGRVASIFREAWTLDDLYASVDAQWAMATDASIALRSYQKLGDAIDAMRRFKAVPPLYEAMWQRAVPRPAPGPEAWSASDCFDVVPEGALALMRFAGSLAAAVGSSPALSVFARKAGLSHVLKSIPVRPCTETPTNPDEVREAALACVIVGKFDLHTTLKAFGCVGARHVYEVYVDAMAALGLGADPVDETLFYENIDTIVDATTQTAPFVSRRTLDRVVQCRDLVLGFAGTDEISPAWVRKLAPYVTTHDDPRAVAREYKRIQVRMTECLDDDDADADARSVFSRA
jgi:hypothetical protein